ncbi:MAG: tetratricopeptide repeat protein [Bacteroidota bacterium]|nr:tetratricopeptide repeat protein [Bacteroidota bacterium]
MLKKRKDLAKVKIKKQDDLLTSYENAVSWFETNKKLLTNVGIALVVIIAAGWFYLNNQHQNNDKAALEFAKVFSYYDNGQYQLAMNGIPERNVRGLQAIVNDYGSTTYGNLAKFYLANCFFNSGEYDKALEAYKDASVSSPLLEASRLAGVAACYEAKGNFDDAAKNFEKAGKYSANDPNAPDNLANAARNYAKAGNKDQAIELYKLIKKEHGSSAAAREAERYLGELLG